MKISFETISERLRQIPFPEVDLVVGIASGGIVPASLIAHQLGKPMSLIHINYLDPHNDPVLISQQTIPSGPCRVLLVDDETVTGRTFSLAKEHLLEHDITTFAMKGHADFVAFPEMGTEIEWAWKVKTSSERHIHEVAD